MIGEAYAFGAPAGTNGGGGLIAFIPIILIFLIFYLLLIRPQQKKHREHQEMLKKLAKGDQVITSGGIHGTIVGFKEGIVVLKIAENVKIEIQLNHISQLKKTAS